MNKTQLTRDALTFGLALATPLLLAASLTGCANDTTAPNAIEQSPSDPSLRAGAIHFRLDLSTGAMTVAGTPANRSTVVTGGKANRALLGSNEVSMKLFHMSHIISKKGRDSLVLDVALVNNLSNSDLVASTSPVPSAQDSIVLAMVQVGASPTGAAIPFGAWRGIDASATNLTKWDMVTGDPCYNGKDCAVWTPVAPIEAGKISERFTIGFTIPRGSIGVDGYLFVAADVRDAPLPGTVVGTLSGIGVGALIGVGVTLDGGAPVHTNEGGMFVFTGIKAGTHTVSYSGIPRYCRGTPQTITVSAAEATQLTLVMECYGILSGTVTVKQGPLPGASVLVNDSVVTTTDLQGYYTSQFVLGGEQTLSLSSIRGCPNPGPIAVTIIPGQTVTRNVSLDCSPLTGTVSGVLTEAGVPLANGTVTLAVDTSLFVVTTGADGSYSIPNVKLGAGLAFGTDDQKPWCSSSISGLPFSLTSESVPVIVNVDMPCIAGPQFGTIPILHGSVNQMFTYQVPATGASDWEIESGSLPAGLTLSPSGVISGKPTAGGLFELRIRITDQYRRAVVSDEIRIFIGG